MASEPLRIGVMEDFAEGMRDMLRAQYADCVLTFPDGDHEEAYLVAARGSDALLVGGTPTTAPIINASDRLQLIQKMGVGIDKVDLDAARARNVSVLRATGVNATAVAEMTLLLILAVLREFPWAVNEQKLGRNRKKELKNRTIQLRGLSAGLVGLGNIGRAVATRLAAFDVAVSYYDPYVNESDVPPGIVRHDTLDALLEQSDIVSLHLMLVPETRNLIDGRRIAQMRDGAILINTARGGVLDEDALCEAVRSGKLRGAGLDATGIEPVPAGANILQEDRIIVTPHIGGAVSNVASEVAKRTYANIKAYFEGRIEHAEDVVLLSGDWDKAGAAR